MRRFFPYVLGTTVVVAVFCVISVAFAEVANRYAGQVIIFNKRPPSRWKTDAVFHRFVKQHRTNKVDARDDGNWRIEYLAFFKRAVNDREVTVIFYDVHDAAPRMINSYSLFIQNPQQRIVGGGANLKRPDFRPNRYHKIVVTSKRKTVARIDRFALIGDEPERTGVVDFTEDE